MRFQLNWRNSSIRARLNATTVATIVAAPPLQIQPLLQALLQIRMPIVATIVAN